jgi:hypothetical protein
MTSDRTETHSESNTQVVAIPIYRRGDKSDAKNAVRDGAWQEGGWRAAIQTPCGHRTRQQKLRGRIQDYNTCRDSCHSRNKLSCNAEPFTLGTICLARWRLHSGSHDRQRMVVRGRVIVGHSWHSARRLYTMVLTFSTGVALAHQCAHPSRSQIPDQQSPQKKYRNWCSHSHFGNCTSLPVKKTKLQGDDQMMLASVIGSTREMTSVSGYSREWFITLQSLDFDRFMAFDDEGFQRSISRSGTRVEP